MTVRLAWVFLAGCGALEVYDLPEPRVPPADTDDAPTGWTPTPDDTSPPFTPGHPDAPDVYRLRLSAADVPDLRALEPVLAGGEDLAIELTLVDAPFLHARFAALHDDRDEQDWCVPTAQVQGAYDGVTFRLEPPPRSLQVAPLPWAELSIAGQLDGDGLTGVVLSAEVPVDALGEDVCGRLPCARCSLQPTEVPDACVTVDLEVEAVLLDGFLLEQLSEGDAAAAPGCG